MSATSPIASFFTPSRLAVMNSEYEFTSESLVLLTLLFHQPLDRTRDPVIHKEVLLSVFTTLRIFYTNRRKPFIQKLFLRAPELIDQFLEERKKVYSFCKYTHSWPVYSIAKQIRGSFPEEDRADIDIYVVMCIVMSLIEKAANLRTALCEVVSSSDSPTAQTMLSEAYDVLLLCIRNYGASTSKNNVMCCLGYLLRNSKLYLTEGGTPNDFIKAKLIRWFPDTQMAKKWAGITTTEVNKKVSTKRHREEDEVQFVCHQKSSRKAMQSVEDEEEEVQFLPCPIDVKEEDETILFFSKAFCV
jgi:hypothetical protein